jgi:hypothetical protein
MGQQQRVLTVLVIDDFDPSARVIRRILFGILNTIAGPSIMAVGHSAAVVVPFTEQARCLASLPYGRPSRRRVGCRS